MNKAIKLSFPLILLATVLSGCNGGNKGISAKSPIAELEQHYVEGTLHQVNVTEGKVSFVEDQHTDFKVLIPANDNARKAASFIVSKITEATGVSPEVVEYNSTYQYVSSDKLIVLGVDEISTQAGVTKTSENLDVTGYQITSKDNSVFIFINHAYGYQQAALCFLKHAVGYDRISERITLYKDNFSKMPNFDIVERPDFQIRTQSNKVSQNYSYETGFLLSNEVFYNSANVKFVHNSFDWANPSLYKKDHPGWYADDASQLCYTAHGDEEELQALIDLVVGEMKQAIDNKPDCTRISLTIEDTHTACTCPACKAETQKYGSEAGSVVKFMNRIDNEIQPYIESVSDPNEPKRNVDLVFFAYNKVEKAPVIKDANGNYAPSSPDVMCNEHVSVYIAPISANYQESFYAEENDSARETIEGWSVVCKRINYWLYETNFSCYLYPLNSYTTMIETYRYCTDKNATYLYNEGQHNQGAVTCFGRLKEYLNQVSEIDVNVDYPTLEDHFFNEYFREAAVPMRKYYNEMQQHMNYLKTEYFGDVTGNIYDNVAQTKFWPKQLLDRWNNYIEEGKELIKEYKYTDYSLYEALMSNLTLESIFPRFALIEHHSGKYTSDALYNMRKSFLDDCAELGVTNIKEGTKLETYKSSWGF